MPKNTANKILTRARASQALIPPATKPYRDAMDGVLLYWDGFSVDIYNRDIVDIYSRCKPEGTHPSGNSFRELPLPYNTCELTAAAFLSVSRNTKSQSLVVHSYWVMGDLPKGAKSLCPFEKVDLFSEEAVVETCQPAIPKPLRPCSLVISHNLISRSEGEVSRRLM